MPVVAQSGPCIRTGCDGRVTFEHVPMRVDPEQPEIEVARCPVCGLRHEREVLTGFVCARWDEDEPPEFDGEYYLT